METRIRILLLILFTIGMTAWAWANWPASADTNLAICSLAGEQTEPKVAGVPDGGCYVSWYDNSSGNYNIYLQRLDLAGVPQWPNGGLLVDGHAQDTWITDYDLAVDLMGNAVLAVNDIRSDPNRDIYAYCVSPTGDMLWGANGITLSSNTDFEPGPRIAILPSGNVAFAWQRVIGEAQSVIDVRKVSPTGQDVWDPPIVTVSIAEGFGLSIPRIVPGFDEELIVEYLRQIGPDFMSPRDIYAQKLDASGGFMWGENGIPLSTVAALDMHIFPDLYPDGIGGAYCCWYDPHLGDNHHAFLQRIFSSGTVMWPDTAMLVSLAGDEIQMAPILTLPPEGGVDIFYMIADPGQTAYGIGGQRFDESGERQWTDNGITFVSRAHHRPCYDICVAPQGMHMTVVYLEATPDTTTALVKAFAVEPNGEMSWPDPVQTLCSVESEKSFLNVDVLPWGPVVAAWTDGRSNDWGDVYLQNINPDGTLGDYSPNPRRTIFITVPDDNSEVTELPLAVQFITHNFVVAPSGGDGVVDVRLNDAHLDWHTDMTAIQINNLENGANTIVLELVNYDHTPLDPAVADTVHVSYDANGSGRGMSWLPRSAVLLPAYPNPFNPTSTITFGVPTEQNVQLVVCDILGREVARLADGQVSAGYHHVSFDASSLAAGIYFCRMQAGSFSSIEKLTLLK